MGKGVSAGISDVSVTGAVSNISGTGSVGISDTAVSSEGAIGALFVSDVFLVSVVGSKASRSISGTSAGSGSGSSS